MCGAGFVRIQMCSATIRPFADSIILLVLAIVGFSVRLLRLGIARR